MTIQQLTHAEDTSSGVLSGRFRRSTSIDESETCRRRVSAAVARAKQGDREALRFLYVKYADNIYSYVQSIVQDPDEAEDVTQHVFAKLISVIGKYEERSVPFTAWLLRLARNSAVDHLRRRRDVVADEVWEAHPRFDAEDDRHRAITLREQLAELPADQREVLVLRHIAGLTPGEIAGRMGKTEPSIHGLHHRGRAALRLALGERECAPTVVARSAA